MPRLPALAAHRADVDELAIGAIELDTVKDKLYWTTATDCEPCSIYHRADYDGSSLETLIPNWFGTAQIALHFSAGTMYFGSGPWVWRSNLDGSNLVEITDAFSAISGVASK